MLTKLFCIKTHFGSTEKKIMILIKDLSSPYEEPEVKETGKEV